jgi:S-(hydroxymethyl)glutathione dehydrogenase/alcohol dehydrogenase
MQPAKEELARKFGATDFVNAGEAMPSRRYARLLTAASTMRFEVIGLKSTSEQSAKWLARAVAPI